MRPLWEIAWRTWLYSNLYQMQHSPPLEKEKFLKHFSGMHLGLGSTIKQHYSFKSVTYFNLQNI